MKPNMVAAAVLAVGAIFLAVVIEVQAQERIPDQWAYTLADQNEDEFVALRTQYGTFRVYLDGGCQYVAANQNVWILEWHESDVKVIAESVDGLWQPTCTMVFQAQMDEVPCMMNLFGDCDVKAENAESFPEVLDAYTD